ncbi:hypothetical protein T484DRAFT_1801587 [Baffinella frigidus]|nr:hypothetical protein T484DRAFT_1801587 [Cryptophyta sp. CCMP2293]
MRFSSVFRLDKYKSIPEAVAALLEILTMDPCEILAMDSCEGSQTVSSAARSHRLLLSGMMLGEQVYPFQRQPPHRLLLSGMMLGEQRSHSFSPPGSSSSSPSSSFSSFSSSSSSSSLLLLSPPLLLSDMMLGEQAVLVRSDLRVSAANVVEMKLSIRAQSLQAAEAVMESVSS